MKKSLSQSTANSKSLPLFLSLLLIPASSFSAEDQVDDGLVLEEIVVTAQKRQERLRDIPISVQALTGEKIENSGINNLQMLSGYVPGLHIAKGVSNTSINIRGIGSGLNKGFEQSVGMYLDGLYAGRSRQYNSPFLDVNRVEVLRGPQGILFGSNTVAGAINIHSENPTIDSPGEYKIAAKFEDYGAREISGFASGSTKHMGIRLALKGRESDGYMDNLTTGEDEMGTDEVAARLTFLYEPNDKLSINTKISHSRFETEGDTADILTYDPISPQPPNLIGTVATALALAMNLYFPEFTDEDFQEGYREDSSDWFTGDAGTETEADSIGITATYDFDNAMTLTSVTGFSSYEMEDRADLDFLPLRALFGSNDEDFAQLSQELRLSYIEGGTFEYVVGVYLEHQDMDTEGSVVLDGSVGGLAGSLLGGVPSMLVLFPPYSGSIESSRFSSFNQDAETYAMFGELVWHWTDQLRVSLGGRYTYNTKDVDKKMSVGGDATGGLDVPTDDAGLLGFWGGLLGSYPHEFGDKRTEQYFDPSLKIQYNTSPKDMVYFNLSRGRKSGGFNASDDIPLTPEGLPAGEWEYEEEKALSAEVGWKTVLAEGAIHYSVAAFVTRYDDLQVATFQGVTFSVGNAAEAEIKGVEMDFRWAATQNIELGGSLSYLDFEFENFENGGCTAQQLVDWDFAGGATDGCRQDLSGKRSAFAPEWSGNIFADYSRWIAGDITFRSTVDLNFRSDADIDYDRDPAMNQPGYGKLNLRLALETETWLVAAYGRNLTDKQTFGYGNDVPLFSGAYTGWVEEPRVYGLEASLNF